MTREEAIRLLEESRRQNRIMRESPTTFFKSSDICKGAKNTEQRIESLNMAIAALRAQQTPDRAHGFWQGEGDGYADGYLVYDVWTCSECGHVIDDGTDDPKLLPNYCPDCGAKMGDDREKTGGNDEKSNCD